MMRTLLLTLLAASAVGCGAGSRAYMIVTAPLADLRAQPGTSAQPGIRDPEQETQLLYGELVRVVSRQGDWAQVEAMEQPEWSHAKRWQGYPGWVKAADLTPVNQLMAPNIMITKPWAVTYFDAFTRSPSPKRFPMGARLRAIDMGGVLWRIELPDGNTVWMHSKDGRTMAELGALPAMQKRHLIVEAAARLLGQPYFWGGRSVNAPGAAHGVLGVDCSGLVNLMYRVAGVDIPRDAHEQFLRAKRVTALHPGDLIFLSAKDRPEKIVHVMLYVGGGSVIEGPGTGRAVRRIALTDRLGKRLEEMSPGTTIDGQSVYFGSYLE